MSTANYNPLRAESNQKLFSDTVLGNLRNRLLRNAKPMLAGPTEL
jgi:hypothetical protein